MDPEHIVPPGNPDAFEPSAESRKSAALWLKNVGQYGPKNAASLARQFEIQRRLGWLAARKRAVEHLKNVASVYGIFSDEIGKAEAKLVADLAAALERLGSDKEEVNP